MITSTDDIATGKADEEPLEDIVEEEATGQESEKSPIPLWKKATAVGAWVLAAFALFVALGNLRGDADDPTPGIPMGPITGTQTDVAPPPDTLGISLTDLRDAWNSVGQPPLFSSDLRRLPEAGPLDSFLYRFDGPTEMVGAYQDDGEYVVALLVTTDADDAGASGIYLHLCHVSSPFSPGCIDSYHENALGGLAFADVAEAGVDTSWQYDGNTWRLTIAGDDMTIRVLAPEG